MCSYSSISFCDLSNDFQSRQGYNGRSGNWFDSVAYPFVTIPVTGTSFNPARSLGPAIFAGGQASSQSWLFIATPIEGAIIGSLAWELVINESEK